MIDVFVLMCDFVFDKNRIDLFEMEFQPGEGRKNDAKRRQWQRRVVAVGGRHVTKQYTKIEYEKKIGFWTRHRIHLFNHYIDSINIEWIYRHWLHIGYMYS